MIQTRRHSVADHWDGPYDEDRFEAWVRRLRHRLTADAVDLALVFATPGYGSAYREMLEIIQIHCQVGCVTGCTGNSLVCQQFEYEHGEGVVVALYHLPGAQLRGFRLEGSPGAGRLTPEDLETLASLQSIDPNGILLFADPFSMDAERLLGECNHHFPGKPVIGGLACGNRESRETTLFLGHAACGTGAVGVAVGGDVTIESALSQGCLPVGDSFTVTAAEKNILERIANRKAYEVLSDVFDQLPDSMKMKSHGNLHVGFVVDEYQDDFRRGDFLVRNLIGADPSRGALLVGASPRVGQTVQFQLRDRHSAMEDMNRHMENLRRSLEGREIYGGLLSTCTGRGKAFFKVPDFDAGAIYDQFGEPGLAGFFGNGEFGPVGARNFVHGYTASLGLLVQKKR